MYPTIIRIRRALRYGAETWHCLQCSLGLWTTSRSDPSKDQSSSRGPSASEKVNGLWPSDLVRGTPDQCEMHFWGERSRKDHPESTRDRYVRDTLWLSNLKRRTPDQSIVHYWGQSSRRGRRSFSFEMPYGY